MTIEEAKELKVGDKIVHEDYPLTHLLVEQVKERGIVCVITDFDKYGAHRHFTDYTGLEKYTRVQ